MKQIFFFRRQCRKGKKDSTYTPNCFDYYEYVIRSRKILFHFVSYPTELIYAEKKETGFDGQQHVVAIIRSIWEISANDSHENHHRRNTNFFVTLPRLWTYPPLHWPFETFQKWWMETSFDEFLYLHAFMEGKCISIYRFKN